MSEPRIIKKYPNRRLYDTAISSYITLVDVRKLVVDDVSFVVLDAKTKEDLTRQILLQIISEEEDAGSPIFSSELLTHIIRSYGGNMQNMVTSYLEKSMDLFAEQQKALREQTRSLIDTNPMAFMTQIAERNLAAWQKMNTNLFTKGESSSENEKNKKEIDK
ncbi:MAG: polyhydroxyalkanoate synthesis repressor PhaR [Gammaproteobacteria bacterium]|nr:MAG: polyhydroxyalkanoate synthesis repressor PhaR [Gammaproteobacteria bacterium]